MSDEERVQRFINDLNERVRSTIDHVKKKIDDDVVKELSKLIKQPQ